MLSINAITDDRRLASWQLQLEGTAPQKQLLMHQLKAQLHCTGSLPVGRQRPQLAELLVGGGPGATAHVVQNDASLQQHG